MYKYEKPFEGIIKKKQLKKAIIWNILNNGGPMSIENLVQLLPKTFDFRGNLQPSRQLITMIVSRNKDFKVSGKVKNRHGHYVNLYTVVKK